MRMREGDSLMNGNGKHLLAQLEAARGLLRELRQRCQLPDWARSQIDKLTATPAPEVRQADQRWSSFDEWLAWELDQGDGTMAAASDAETRLARRLWFCLERAALAEQGERQEAFGYVLFGPGNVVDWTDDEEVAKGWADAEGYSYKACYATPQPGQDVRGLVSFALELIDGAGEGGSFDGGDIQDAGVRHGLLVVEQRDESCGEHCDCAEYGFPAECYRLTPALATHRQACPTPPHPLFYLPTT